MPFDFIVLDMHCDTLDTNSKTLRENGCQFKLSDALAYRGYIQFFAVWATDNRPFDKAVRLIARFEREMEENADIAKHCASRADIDKALSEHKIACLLAIEDGGAFEGSIDKFLLLSDMQIKYVTLVWNNKNEIATGALCDASDEGLTDFGKELIRVMEKEGVLVDVSHMSEKGFWDVCETAKKPFLASHSNSYKVCPHKRNLTDAQFRAIADMGGVVGVTFFPAFLKQSEPKFLDVLDHIEHFLSLGGEDHVGLGSDFDGFLGLPEDGTGVRSMAVLLDELCRLYGDEIAEKIAYKNFLRLL